MRKFDMDELRELVGEAIGDEDEYTDAGFGLSVAQEVADKTDDPAVKEAALKFVVFFRMAQDEIEATAGLPPNMAELAEHVFATGEVPVISNVAPTPAWFDAPHLGAVSQ